MRGREQPAGTERACEHPTHRTIRLFMPFNDAKAAWIRFKIDSTRPVAASPLRQIRGGYEFDCCSECLLERQHSA